MTDPDTGAFDIASTFVGIWPGGVGKALPVTGSFWPDLAAGRIDCEWLGGVVHMAQSPGHAEMHPDGEELLMAISGHIDVVLEEPGGERTVELREGHACIVPRGVWHRQVVREPGRLLFLTAGRGTEHKPLG